MTYFTFIQKAMKATIHQLDNGVWFLEPEWHDIICRDITEDIEHLSDSYIKCWYDIEDILKLETEKRNKMHSKKEDVVNWLYDVITAVVEPAVLQEETDYVKQVIEFMKTNHGLKLNEE